MRAVIMAGGAGSRLNLGEKPLVLCYGRPMISYVVDAFYKAGHEPVVAVTSLTPMTQNWCQAQGIEFCRAKGNGYIPDMVEVVTTLEETSPLFVCVSDIPCITPAHLKTIETAYKASGKSACSTWVPASLMTSGSGTACYSQEVNGIMACPVGMNILSGDKIKEPQDELQLLLSDPRLAVNVNTRADLVRAGRFLTGYS
ncbi:MAG: NTP transferase domain-containing protein [Methanoregula sp.]|nr:NTP transferase domain-containing protein [Methanoregula sp.]